MALTRVLSVAFAISLALAPISRSDPDDPSMPSRPEITPLPAVTAVSSNWQPKYPFPFDKMRGEVTDGDIVAGREMCQWFQAQYYALTTQVDTLSYFLGGVNGDYRADGIQAKADVVTSNIDRAVEFLEPRAQALTQSTDFAGDVYFPMYQGENFYRLWQQLYNVGMGIKSRHSSWDFGPPMRLAEHYGSLINSSHICR